MNNMENPDRILLQAAKSGDRILVKKALESNADINFYEGSTTALLEAAYYGHLHIVQHLIEFGANPYLPYDCKSPRDWALFRKHADIANILESYMKSTKSLDTIDDKSGFTPLTGYLFYESKTQALEVIDFGADVCKTDKSGKTPLFYAVRKNYLDVVKELLAKGAMDYHNLSALKCAFNMKSSDIVKCLVETNPALILDAFFDDGFTPLTKAIDTRNPDITKYLLELGADPGKVDLNQNHPLDLALERQWVSTCKTLISKCLLSGNKDILNGEFPKYGCTPLSKALFTDNDEVAKYLIEQGADPAKADLHQNHPLQIVLESCNEPIFHVLMSKYLETPTEAARILNESFGDGFTPLTKSIEFYRMNMAEFLIEHGVDLEKADRNNNIPLEFALEVNLAEIAEVLVSKGVEVPRRISDSLFHKLAANGDIEVYEFLVKNGWDVNQIDENGKSSLALYASNENLSLTKFLIENGARIDLALTEVEAFKVKNSDFARFLQKFTTQSGSRIID